MKGVDVVGLRDYFKLFIIYRSGEIGLSLIE